MELQRLGQPYSICKIPNLNEVDMSRPFWFLLHTDEELTLVCETAYEPDNAIDTEQGYEAFRVVSAIDFHELDIIGKISHTLAKAEISVFTLSTFDSVYFLIEDEFIPQARELLAELGHHLN